MNYYTMGIFVGVITALIIYILVNVIFKDKNKEKREFDERQLLMQGKAAKAAMWTAIVSCGIVGLVSVFGTDFCPVGIAMFMVIAATVMVYVIVAIHYDAYLGFKANTKKQYTAFVLLFVVMVLNVITSADSNGFIRDGRMTVAWLPLTAVIMYIVLFAALLIHNGTKKMEESEEE